MVQMYLPCIPQNKCVSKDNIIYICIFVCHSVPEPKRLQRVHRGLGAANVLPMLPVLAEQHQAGGPVHGPVLRPPHLFRGIGVRHTLRRPQSRGSHMRHD